MFTKGIGFLAAGLILSAVTGCCKMCDRWCGERPAAAACCQPCTPCCAAPACCPAPACAPVNPCACPAAVATPPPPQTLGR
jgi:hypothetical protein